jgi:hypothetical protein
MSDSLASLALLLLIIAIIVLNYYITMRKGYRVRPPPKTITALDRVREGASEFICPFCRGDMVKGWIRPGRASLVWLAGEKYSRWSYTKVIGSRWKPGLRDYYCKVCGIYV